LATLVGASLTDGRIKKRNAVGIPFSGLSPMIWFARRLDNLARAGAAFGTQAGTAAGLARLFVVFAAAHFFLNSATLDQLPKAADSFLNRFFFSHVQLNHKDSVARERVFGK
jgi:hypothetical protein